MWLITTLLAAAGATALWMLYTPVKRRRYRLSFLCLMLWGASAMILTDHVIGYDGGDFIQMETDGLIANGALLGMAMLVPILIIWALYVLLSANKTRKTGKAGK